MQLSLYWACELGSAPHVKTLLSLKADPDKSEKDFRPVHGTNGALLALPMVTACLKGHVDCAKLLLASGAKVDMRMLQHAACSMQHGCAACSMQHAQAPSKEK